MAIIRQANIERVARDASELHLGDLQAQARTIESAAAARARTLEEQGQAERARIIAGAREEGLRLGREEGFEQGRREGLEAGKRSALEEHRARLAALEEGLSAALAEFVREREDLLLAARQDLVSLALAIASRVVKREIRRDPGVVGEQVLGVVASAARGSRLLLRLHPEDLEIVRAVMPRVAAIAGGDVELAADGSLARGSVVARSARGGEIDASLGTQLDRIAAELLPLGTAPSGEAGEGSA